MKEREGGREGRRDGGRDGEVAVAFFGENPR